MLHRRKITFSILLLSCLLAVGKEKKGILLPADILQAHTVLVVVDPDAGVTVHDPNANSTARDDVEKALMKWGRLSPVQEATTADLIITVRKGTGKTVEPTIAGVPINSRPIVLQPTDSGARIGVRKGNAQRPGDPSNTQAASSNPHPQVEVGQSQDLFVVYRGSRDNPLDSPPVWRYTAKNALQSPGVPAVEVFRKLVAESEKQP